MTNHTNSKITAPSRIRRITRPGIAGVSILATAVLSGGCTSGERTHNTDTVAVHSLPTGAGDALGAALFPTREAMVRANTKRVYRDAIIAAAPAD